MASKTVTAKADNKKPQKQDVKKTQKVTKEKVEPGDKKPNQTTTKAGLNFDCNSCKKWIKIKCRDDSKFVRKEKKDKDTEEKTEETGLPGFSGSFIALAAINEELCRYILNVVNCRLEKDKTGLFPIEESLICDLIKLTPELNENISVFMNKYDKTINYKEQFYVKEIDMKKYVEKFFNKSAVLTPKAFNVITYILLKTSIRLIDTAYIIILESRRKTLNHSVVMRALDIHFTGELKKVLLTKAEEAIKLCEGEIDESDDKAEEGEDDGEAEVAEKPKKEDKVSPKKPVAKKGAKPKEEVVEEVEEEAPEEEEEQEEEAEEEEVEEEEAEEEEEEEEAEEAPKKEEPKKEEPKETKPKAKSPAKAPVKTPVKKV